MTDDIQELIEQIGEKVKAEARTIYKLGASSSLPEPDELIEDYDDLPAMLAPSGVAPYVGKSKSWVLQHIEFFPGTRRDEHGHYLIPKKAMLRYLQTRTERI